MPVRPALYPLLALCAGAGPVAAQTTLPGGDSTAFRQRMTDWSAPAPQPVIAPPQQSPVPAVMPRLSSGYGYRADPLHGGGRMHYGLDIPGPLGTPVFASGGGFVAFAGAAGSYGRMVEIDHGSGLRTRYAHLSRLLVRAGDPVAPQQEIALMGSTGRSTGSHLHFEVRVNGRATDPFPLLGGAPPPRSARPMTIADTAPHISDFARRRAPADPVEGTP
ncbi:murein DD-endopeptidase MepM/ murein hydrolase activator NlpD [Sphingopyxis panaciterrae]|uniref:M23 family metallopeptidase n=1 Tax=Sphingopyxis panaciterrae TaxID=363841 RepID=UPI00141E2516|nr:M23 family metallopeptidase [Sphingopyxis panaciterrae]NIJ36033.1 murein DD-endopeptidase MepM/ murein hydrolase activator NlpD [Sphingopyxis panaciterrae]